MDEQRAWRIKYVTKAEIERTNAQKGGRELSAQEQVAYDKINQKIFVYKNQITDLTNRIDGLNSSNEKTC